MLVLKIFFTFILKKRPKCQKISRSPTNNVHIIFPHRTHLCFISYPGDALYLKSLIPGHSLHPFIMSL